MKKFYVAPEMEVEKVDVESAILTTSGSPSGGSADIVPDEGVELI